TPTAGDEDEVVFVEDEADEADFSDLRSAPPRPVGPREVSLATQLEGSDDNDVELSFEDAGDAEPELTLEEGEEEAAEEPEAAPALAAAEPQAEPEAEPEDEPEPEAELPAELVEALEEADFYLAQKLSDEAREVVMEALDAHPEHPALLAKLAAIDAEPSAAEAEPIEDRSFVLAEKLAVEASSGTQAPENVEQVLKQFKAGIAQQVDKSDTATHHDLGIAYMEMGLHADAIEQFKLCLGQPDKQCLAHTMIGLSYAAKGEPPNAIEHFRRALQSPTCTDAERLGLWFELGQSHERLGKPKEALGWYEQVAGKDPSFRDVSTRIERLGRKQGSEEESEEFDAMFDNMIVKD
ncbi:MAG: tetratricopeptide repeat protein, partial [Polyangiales bacterium]